MSILRLYQYLETKRQSKHSTGRCSKHDSGERCHEEAHMHQDPSGMLARIPFGLTTGPIEGAEILVAGCRKETVASEMRSNVLKYRDTLFIFAYHQFLMCKSTRLRATFTSTPKVHQESKLLALFSIGMTHCTASYSTQKYFPLFFW